MYVQHSFHLQYLILITNLEGRSYLMNHCQDNVQYSSKWIKPNTDPKDGSYFL